MGAFAPGPTGKGVLGGILGGNHCIAHLYGVAFYGYAGGAHKRAQNRAKVVGNNHIGSGGSGNRNGGILLHQQRQLIIALGKVNLCIAGCRMHNANGILRLVSREIQMGSGAVVIQRFTLFRFKGKAVDSAGNGKGAATLGGLAYIHITQQIRSKAVYRTLLGSRHIHIILAIVGFINGAVAAGYRIGNGGTAVLERCAVDGGADAAGRFIGAGVSSNHKAGVLQLGCGLVNFGLGGLFRRIGTYGKACHIVSALFRILRQQIRTGFIGVLKVLPTVHRVLILVCIGYIAGKALVISRLVLLYHLFQFRKVCTLGQILISGIQILAHIQGGLVCGQQRIVVQIRLRVQ